MIRLKTKEEIAILREGGKRLSEILSALSEAVVPGVYAEELNSLAMKLIEKGGDKPAFLNYTPYGAHRPYPAALCVSINEEIVHGIPNESPKIISDGDIVGLDTSIIHNNLITDSAVTVLSGNVDNEGKLLVERTKEALSKGIQAAKPGKTVGDIGFAIEKFIKPFGYGIVRELAGHGVGYKVHEDPYVPNFGNKGEGPKLRPGMVIAIEPMVNEGGEDIILEEDGYTYRTADGKRSAHFEHTIAITEKGAEILTA